MVTLVKVIMFQCLATFYHGYSGGICYDIDDILWAMFLVVGQVITLTF